MPARSKHPPLQVGRVTRPAYKQIKNNMDMKTAKRIKLAWAVVCTIIAIALCIAVCQEWKAQGVDLPFSFIAACLFYCAGCVGLWIGGKEFVDFIDYWFGNGDEYYKWRK